MKNRGKERNSKREGKGRGKVEREDRREREKMKRKEKNSKREGKRKWGKRTRERGFWCCEVNANNAVIWFRSNVKKKISCKGIIFDSNGLNYKFNKFTH